MHVMSGNTDPPCQMTAMAGTLVDLARKLGVAIPAEVASG
jgi:hypothetical protein